MPEPQQSAPGWPGIAPRWTSSAKSGVGAALSPLSRVWFTLSHGILNEIYCPRVDQAATRDLVRCLPLLLGEEVAPIGDDQAQVARGGLSPGEHV